MRLLLMMYWTITCTIKSTWSWISIQTSLSPLGAAHWLIPKWNNLQIIDEHLNGIILLFAMTKWGTWINRFCLRTKSCFPFPVLSLWVAWCPLIGAVISSFSHLGVYITKFKQRLINHQSKTWRRVSWLITFAPSLGDRRESNCKRFRCSNPSFRLLVLTHLKTEKSWFLCDWGER